MIYRKREVKRSFELKVTPKGNFLKIAFGKHLWYFELWEVWHTLTAIKDRDGVTTVSHICNKNRKTVDRFTADILGVY